MRKRVEMHRLEEMVRLHRLGTTKHEVARMLVMSPNTERVYRGALAAAGSSMGRSTRRLHWRSCVPRW